MRKRGIIGLILAAATLGLCRADAVEIGMMVTEVKDTRSTSGSSFYGLELKISLFGEQLDDAEAYRFKLISATDDTGRKLVKEDRDANKFKTIDLDRSGPLAVEVNLKNPSRKAGSLAEIAGEVEVYRSELDPASVVTIPDIAPLTKLQITDPAVVAAKIELTLYSSIDFERERMADRGTHATPIDPSLGGAAPPPPPPPPSALSYFGIGPPSEGGVIVIGRDPESKLVRVEFIDEAGKPIRENGWSSSGDVKSYDFKNPLPKGTRLRVYILTEKSILRVPVALKDVLLP